MNRDAKFRETFDTYLEKLKTQFRLQNLYTDDLELIVDDVDTNVYRFRIPERYIYYYIDAPHRGANGEMLEAGPMYKTQDQMPTCSTIAYSFQQYFGNYQLKDEQTGEIKSGCELKVEMGENTNDLRFAVIVRYLDQYEAYPSKPTPLHDLEITNIGLIRRVEILEKERAIVTRQLSSMANKIKNIYSELYTGTEKGDECPVCYEVIEPVNLHVPVCAHYICANCSQRCSVCPICRGSS
jgi:hypothetical protein